MKVEISKKKSAKVLAVSRKMTTFAAMKARKFIITGVNQLTGRREQLSRPMEEQEARQRLDRENASRKYQRHAAHTRLKLEAYEAVQLTINFEEYGN